MLFSTTSHLSLTKLLLSIVFLHLTACVNTPTKSDLSSKTGNLNAPKLLDQYIREQMKEYAIVGLSIAVLDGQNVAWEQGFGYANEAEKIPATAYTRYRAGSISKVLTATAIMQLAEAGKVDLDAPLVKALPNFSIQSHDPQAEPISLRMIMTHHAGLPADYMEGMWAKTPAHFTSVVEALHHEYRSFKPNTVHAYSNVGFTLLGAAVQQVSSVPYETYIQSRVLAPLKMSNSNIETVAPSGEGAALAYDEKGYLRPETGLRDTPAGGLNTTVVDLVKFGSMWFNDVKPHEVLNKTSLNEMKTPQNSTSPLDADLKIGLAWHLMPNPANENGTVLFHNGATINYRSALFVSPEDKVAVAVMSNSANSMQTIDEIGKKALQFYSEKKTGRVKAASNQANHYPPVNSENYSGCYATAELGLLEIKNKLGKLSVDIGGKTLTIKTRPNGYMGLEYKLLGLFSINLGHLSDIEFTLATILGHEVLLAKYQNRFYLAGEKVYAHPISSAWTARLGEYQYIGSDETVTKSVKKLTLTINNGFLLASVYGDEDDQTIPLTAINDHQVITSGLGRGRGETITFFKTDEGVFFQHEGLKFKQTSYLNQQLGY